MEPRRLAGTTVSANCKQKKKMAELMSRQDITGASEKSSNETSLISEHERLIDPDAGKSDMEKAAEVRFWSCPSPYY